MPTTHEQMREALEAVLSAAVDPENAKFAMMVDLAPIRAALALPAPAPDARLVEALITCPKCNGKKGFDDTTYDRTGEWVTCPRCEGNGTVFDEKKLRAALAATATSSEEKPLSQVVTWIDVKERLPEEDGLYNVCESIGQPYGKRFWLDDGRFLQTSEQPIAHWAEPLKSAVELQGGGK